MTRERRLRLLAAAALPALLLVGCTGGREDDPAQPAAVEVAVDGGDDALVGTAPVRVGVQAGDVVRIRNANTGSTPTHLFSSVAPGEGPSLFTPVAGGAVPNAGVWGSCLGGTADAGTRACPVVPVEAPDAWDGRSYLSLGPQLPGEVRELTLADDLASQLADGGLSLWCRLHPGLRVDLVAGEATAPSPPSPSASDTGPRTGSTASPEVVVAPQAEDTELLAFAPSRLEVPVGTEITWTVPGASPHTVEFGGDPELLHAEPAEARPFAPPQGLAPGGTARSGYLSHDPGVGQPSFRLRFDRPGTYRYACRFHPQMTGAVVVTATTSTS